MAYRPTLTTGFLNINAHTLALRPHTQIQIKVISRARVGMEHRQLDIGPK